jgi:hypothetical protein
MDLKQGLYHDIPFDEYLQIPAVSKSYMKALDECPKKAYVQTLSRRVEDESHPLFFEETPAMIRGSGTHAFVLESYRAFCEAYWILPEDLNLRTKAGKERYAELCEEQPNKQPIAQKDFNDMFGMAVACTTQPLAVKLLIQGLSESTVIWQDEETGLWCKCRPDWRPADDKGVCVDLKTCTSAEEDDFMGAVRKFGYDVQASFYLDGLKAVTGKSFEIFAFIAVESSYPHRTEVYTMSEEWLAHGRRKYRRLLNKELDCRDKGYPHYNNAGASELQLPAWIERKEVLK